MTTKIEARLSSIRRCVKNLSYRNVKMPLYQDMQFLLDRIALLESENEKCLKEKKELFEFINRWA